MHVLHRILLNIENLKTQDREETINSIRSFADLETEDFCGTVFDWRETSNAGGWSDEFPNNVILGSENLELIIQQIERCQELQKNEINRYLKLIKEKLGDSLTTIIELSFNEYNEISHQLYQLKNLADLLYGKYTFDSYFYDLGSRTSKITNHTMEKIRQSPENWALVLFDYHF